MDGRRGQSETLGYALILGFTLISVGAIVMFGGTALQTTQEQIGVQNAENAMSQFDSRASMVALGQQTSQRVTLGAAQQGAYRVEPDAGWIRIVHENETANETTELYNGTLGAVIYADGTREIAYQGGGVWRKDEGSVMLSPPEFHYRGSTLTLPLVQMQGSGTVSGNPVATIRQNRAGKRLFPNASAEEPSTNPVQSGVVSVTVKSEYYTAWADYFRSRTDGNVTENERNGTAKVALIAPAIQGDFDIPLEGNTMTLQGIQSHQIDEFTLSLIDDEDDNADFSDLDWSIYAESGSKEFELNVKSGGGAVKDGDQAITTIYYSPDGTNYQMWTTETFVFETESETGDDFNDDGDTEDKRLILNLTNTGNATYEKKSVQPVSNYGFSANSFQDEVTFNEHDVDGEQNTYTEGANETVGFLINHYLALMGPTVDLTVSDKNKNDAAGTVSEELSSGFIQYNATENSYLTYMHITENPANVTVE